jgi:selenide,water dikinase
VQNTTCGLEISYSQLPWISCAEKYAKQYTFPGGASDNRIYFEQYVEYSEDLEDWQKMLLFDPQTSGGLLMGIPDHKLEGFLKEAVSIGQKVWNIGTVVEGNSIRIIR